MGIIKKAGNVKQVLIITVVLCFWANYGTILQASEKGDKSKKVTTSKAPKKIVSELGFSEGPTVDEKGNLYFSDVRNNRICKWNKEDGFSIFRENTGGANGLFFDGVGNLVICEGKNRRVTSLSPDGELTVLADKYKGKPFNAPNDLWIDQKGGVYFTDPLYGKGPLPQDGEHVYYITPDRNKVIRVANNLKKPNGLVGTQDGKKLYVGDDGAKKTFVFDIKEDGTLKNKKLFAEEGSDGMTIDDAGNIYLTSKNLVVYDRHGKLVQSITLPERPTNVSFSNDGKALYVTDRKTVYVQQMNSHGKGKPKRQ